MNVKDELKSKRDRIVEIKKELKLFKKAVAFWKLRELDVTCVSTISLYEHSTYFYLDTESSPEVHRDFVHALAQAYGVKFEKYQAYESLNLSGEVADGTMIYIRGYVPPTCKLVEKEVEAADWEVEDAKKELERLQALVAQGKKIVKEVVCH